MKPLNSLRFLISIPLFSITVFSITLFSGCYLGKPEENLLLPIYTQRFEAKVSDDDFSETNYSAIAYNDMLEISSESADGKKLTLILPQMPDQGKDIYYSNIVTFIYERPGKPIYFGFGNINYISMDTVSKMFSADSYSISVYMMKATFEEPYAFVASMEFENITYTNVDAPAAANIIRLTHYPNYVSSISDTIDVSSTISSVTNNASTFSINETLSAPSFQGSAIALTIDKYLNQGDYTNDYTWYENEWTYKFGGSTFIPGNNNVYVLRHDRISRRMTLAFNTNFMSSWQPSIFSFHTNNGFIDVNY